MNNTLSPELATRSVGAMIFFVFGYLWIMYWAMQAYASNWLVAGLITLTGGLLLLSAIKVHSKHKPALKLTVFDLANANQQKRTARIFHMINAGQGFAMFVSANILINLGLSQWIVCAMIFIVGLHFIPLARLLNHSTHYIVGATLMIWAVSFPLLTASGPANPVGCLGTGLILWAAAIVALSRKSASISTEQFAPATH